MPYKLTEEQIKTAVESGAMSLADYCREHNIHYVVTGVSGGLDSAVTLGLARKACQLAEASGFKLASVGLIMPCDSAPEAEALGREAIEKFGAREVRLDLGPVFEYAYANLTAGTDEQIKKILAETGGERELKDWDESRRIAQGNIKARLRMIFGTYHTARMVRGLVLSTDNLSEYWMAFWTLHGDVGDFGMIQHVLKGLELYDIARYLGVPEGIIAARPDDGLGVAGGDEDQLGAAYPALDRIMIKLLKSGFDPEGGREQLDKLPEIEGVPAETVRRLAGRCLAGAFKRRGSISLTRADLGLPKIGDIEL